MHLWKNRIIQAFCVMTLIVSEVMLSFILIWIIEGHGVIACGRGIFDSPTWLLSLVVFIGAPTILMIGSVLLYLWCSKHAITA